MRLFIVISSLILSTGYSYSGDDFFYKKNVSVIEDFSFPMEISIESLVHVLRFELGLKVNFENERVKFKEDGLSAYEIVKMYDNIDAKNLSVDKKNLLETAKEMLMRDEGHLIIDYKKTYIVLQKTDFMDLSKLIAKIKSTATYNVVISNSSIIIYPNNIHYQAVSHFEGSFNSFHEALEGIKWLLKERHLLLGNRGKITKSEQNRKIILNVKNEDFRIFLTRFTEAIGNDYVWNITGYDSARRITFLRINFSK